MIRYVHAATNTGNLAINDISITDTTNGHDPDFLAAVSPGQPVLVTLTSDTGTINDAADGDNAGPVWDTLAPGDTITFSADYIVQQADVDNLQ